jgi:hypothetical protein
MRCLLGLFLYLFSYSMIFADTIDHYMNIANGIPQMEMKADSQSQAWARSARNILVLTSESIIESLILANEEAKKHGYSLFCIPPATQITAEQANALIQQTFKESNFTPAEKNKLTVSQIALSGLAKKFPCSSSDAKEEAKGAQIQHVSANN